MHIAYPPYLLDIWGMHCPCVPEDSPGKRSRPARRRMSRFRSLLACNTAARLWRQNYPDYSGKIIRIIRQNYPDYADKIIRIMQAKLSGLCKQNYPDYADKISRIMQAKLLYSN